MREASWRRTVAASLVICVAGGGLLWRGTEGLRALTSEQARRTAIARAPRPIPAVGLEDQDGRPFTLGDYRGRPLVVDFVYTRCTSLCPLLGAEFIRIDRAQAERPAGDRLQLVTITFDPRDGTDALREYAQHHQADGRGWRLARVRDSAQLPLLLGAFGVVVIGDGAGEFQHNAALHVIDRRGRLARLLDPDAPPAAVERAIAARER